MDIWVEQDADTVGGGIIEKNKQQIKSRSKFKINLVFGTKCHWILNIYRNYTLPGKIRLQHECMKSRFKFWFSANQDWLNCSQTFCDSLYIELCTNTDLVILQSVLFYQTKHLCNLCNGNRFSQTRGITVAWRTESILWKSCISPQQKCHWKQYKLHTGEVKYTRW